MTSDSPNTADIVERLNATHFIALYGDPHGGEELVNPDGPEAAAIIKELRGLLYESLYHLRIDEAAAAYHVRAAAAALKGHKNAKAMKARSTLAKVTKQNRLPGANGDFDGV
jgi:hypothetical protein